MDSQIAMDFHDIISGGATAAGAEALYAVDLKER